jgi:hypothetical protein
MSNSNLTRRSRTQVVLVGQSVGCGPAVEFAARGVGARVALLSPFASIAQMAEAAFPLVTPGVRALPALVRDKFDNLGKVRARPAAGLSRLLFHRG